MEEDQKDTEIKKIIREYYEQVKMDRFLETHPTKVDS